MDSDQGKLFMGGISWETTEEKLRDHFAAYGEVDQAVIMRDKLTGRPRGFGFVVFADPAALERALLDPHTIDGRTIEAKRALSREEQQAAKAANPSVGRNVGSTGNIRTKKIFVGGLPATLTEEGFRQYFQTYGNVTDVVVMYDQNTQRPRGFGFISFDSEDAVDRVLHKTFHDLDGKLVEVKRALPREVNPTSGGRSGAGGPYQGHNGSNPNIGNYNGRSDANRYMQPQKASGGYPSYGPGGYGTPGYGYGPTNPGGGYGNYGVGGYGGASSGYGGPAGSYGNPNTATSGYQGGPPGANRGHWSSQSPSAYVSGSYGGNAGYGASGAWNVSSGGGGGAPTSQTPGASTGYGNQGYGYGGYGGDGSYGNQGGYGAYGGRGDGASNTAVGAVQGASSGYPNAGYGGGSGYPNAWRSDPSQGGGYGGPVNGPSGGQTSFGGAQPRPTQ